MSAKAMDRGKGISSSHGNEEEEPPSKDKARVESSRHRDHADHHQTVKEDLASRATRKADELQALLNEHDDLERANKGARHRAFIEALTLHSNLQHSSSDETLGKLKSVLDVFEETILKGKTLQDLKNVLEKTIQQLRSIADEHKRAQEGRQAK